MPPPYVDHFTLTEPPFSKEIPDADLWLPSSKQAVVEALLEALDKRAYAWDSRSLLSLVLVGLPELCERLALRRNRSLYSRSHHRLEVSALTPDDTAEYLRMRVARAGCHREVFASDAIVVLHEAPSALCDLDRLAAALPATR
jgi:type II secretory pathway predicted ATPase ExeA